MAQRRGKDKKQEKKILRIGIVQDGRIVEERLLRKREPVSVGQLPKNTFILTSVRAPLTYRLFEVKRGKYILCFEKGMLGKVLVGHEVLDLKTIAKRRLAQRSKNRFFFPLSEDARGKIVLGDSTLLFQFVTAPPEVPRLQLPAEARGAWWRTVDKTFLIIVVISLYSVGGVAGYLEAWWNYTGKYEFRPRKVAATIQRWHRELKAKKKLKQAEEKKEESGGKKDKETGILENTADAPKSKMTADESLKIDEAVDKAALAEAEEELGELTEGAGDEGRIDEEQLSSTLDEKLSAMRLTPPRVNASSLARAQRLVSKHTGVGIIGSEFAEGGEALDDSLFKGARRLGPGRAFSTGPLEYGSFGPGSAYAEGEDLTDIADMPSGTQDLGFGPGGGGGPGEPISLSARDLGLPNGGNQSGTMIVGPKKKLRRHEEKSVKAVKFALRLPGARGVVGGKLRRGDLNRLIKKRQVAFKRCYSKYARASGGVGGRIDIRVRVDLNGRATARVIRDTTGDPRIGRCIVEKIRRWTFPKPEGKPVDFTIPLVFRSM